MENRSVTKPLQTRRTFLKSIGLSAAAAVSSCATTALGAKDTEHDKKPNIVIIFTDDQGYADVGCYGAKKFKTPNLDKMAAGGLRLTDFYVAASVCTPSRTALMTGAYPKRFNMHKGVLLPMSKKGLDPSALTIGELLQKKGYATACIGKWHLGHATEKLMPNNQGFDYYFGIPYSNDMDARTYGRTYKAPPLPVYENRRQVDAGMDQRFFTKRFTKKALDFIAANEKRPFFLYLAHPMPHTPIHVSPDFMHKSTWGPYGDTIQELDWSVGQILSTLKTRGLDRNTLVIFTSDNGPDQGWWQGGNHGFATPLRGSKGSTWEGGFRVPCIIQWRGKLPVGKVVTQMVTAMDIFPTVAKLAGARIPNTSVVDGHDIMGLLKDPETTKSPTTEFLFYATNGKCEAIRIGDWKLHVAKRRHWDRTKGPFPLNLYNLREDIGERKNVAAKFPKIAARLKQRLLELDKEME
jgi:arylsulfatase A